MCNIETLNLRSVIGKLLEFMPGATLNQMQPSGATT